MCGVGKCEICGQVSYEYGPLMCGYCNNDFSDMTLGDFIKMLEIFNKKIPQLEMKFIKKHGFVKERI